MELAKMLKILIITYFSIIKEISSGDKIECGYKQCPQARDGALNVHIIPHSHMDAGWVKTFDQYYYGTKSTISSASVQLIYHSVLSELLHDKRRKFTFSETAYFWRWWKEQRGATRSTFRMLVGEGRIQFAGGGWVQADEATVDYHQLLDQYTWGLRKLNDTIGPCGTPKAAWQVDTYGHSKEHASLLAQMGFDGLFIGRVDHKVREAMLEEDRMEFMWRGSDVLGKMSDILTHTLYNLYNAPDGFCFDLLCSDEPIVDDPESAAFNAESRVNTFISLVEKQAKYYEHDNIMVTMGGDFTYQSAANWFMNIDKLINHVTSHSANMSDINIFYSTPSCYLKAVYLHGRRDKTLYTEMNDHLPYGSDINTYWTGFYTSRPSFKYFVKKTHTFLQVVKQLSVLSRMKDSYELHLLRHAVSLVLHHDAITGTSQQHVANDFIKILSDAVYACTKKISLFLSVLTPTWGGRRSKNNQQFVVCHQLNISQCRFTETQDSMLLLIYNPSSVKTYHHIRFPVLAMHYSIKNYNNEEVEHQLVPLPTAMINLPGRSSTALQELCFEAENIPPLGFTTYYVTSVRDQLAEGEFAKTSQTIDSGTEQERLTSISNEYIKVTINKTNGLLESIQHVDGIKIMLSQNWYYYSQAPNMQNSGAYSFRPGQNRPVPVTDKAIYNTIRGTLVKEIRQRFSDWITQITRLYRGEEFVEIEWIIGPVPIDKDLGKEVVTIIKTNITNNGVFYTDSNGRQMMQRNCWNQSIGGTNKRKLPSCLYPVGKICIENSKDAFCVLTDRTQGGTSYNEGEIELMVHRRLLTDDTFGLEESLNEEEFGIGLVVRGKHRIFVGNHRQEVDDLSFFERVSQMYRRWTFEPWLFMTQGEKISKRKWQNVRNKRAMVHVRACHTDRRQWRRRLTAIGGRSAGLSVYAVHYPPTAHPYKIDLKGKYLLDKYTGLRLHGLPHHIHILTLEPWKGGSVLLRLENTLEKSHDDRSSSTSPPNSGHITVDLRKIFLFIITKVEETTLGANQWLQQARQMDWSSRYVYNGGDDGILPEDNPDYVDELRTSKEEKEPGLYSEEIYPKSSNIRQTRNKKKETGFANESRRKRFVNTTDNGDNIKPDIATDRQNIYNNNNYTLDAKNGTQKTQISKIKKSYKRLSFLKSSKPSVSEKRKNFESISREDGSSSVEDFSRPKKKRGNKKRNKTSTDYRVIDDSDDGVTKSIYEMYYKTEQRRKSFKPYLRGSEDNLEDSRIKRRNDEATPRRISKDNNNRRYKTRQYDVDSKENTRNIRKLPEDSDEFISRSKRRRTGFEVPFINEQAEEEFRKLRYREQYGEEYDRVFYPKEDKTNRDSRYQRRREYINVSHEESSLEMNEEDRFKDTRIKRATNENSDQPEHLERSKQTEQEDYSITLRPTQIRTFIIWFKDKRTYTL